MAGEDLCKSLVSAEKQLFCLLCKETSFLILIAHESAVPSDPPWQVILSHEGSSQQEPAIQGSFYSNDLVWKCRSGVEGDGL